MLFYLSVKDSTVGCIRLIRCGLAVRYDMNRMTSALSLPYYRIPPLSAMPSIRCGLR